MFVVAVIVVVVVATDRHSEKRLVILGLFGWLVGGVSPAGTTCEKFIAAWGFCKCLQQ